MPILPLSWVNLCELLRLIYGTERQSFMPGEICHSETQSEMN